jgi:hypothetical protein
MFALPLAAVHTIVRYRDAPLRTRSDARRRMHSIGRLSWGAPHHRTARFCRLMGATRVMAAFACNASHPSMGAPRIVMASGVLAFPGGGGARPLPLPAPSVKGGTMASDPIGSDRGISQSRQERGIPVYPIIIIAVAVAVAVIGIIATM